MCTVVVRWSGGQPVHVLALRDELVGREFDDPDEWWPAHPGVVGGRDRTAGGSWCVSDVATGSTGLVLNRPERRLAAPGAPSRGVLPLLAVTHGTRWSEHVGLDGMASFALVLSGPDALRLWTFDGVTLRHEELGEGTHLVTSGGAEDGKVPRYLPAFRAGSFPDDWSALLRAAVPAPEPSALVLRGEVEGKVYATVFGQLFSTVPGELEVSWSRQPWGAHAWTTRRWGG